MSILKPDKSVVLVKQDSLQSGSPLRLEATSDEIQAFLRGNLDAFAGIAGSQKAVLATPVFQEIADGIARNPLPFQAMFKRKGPWSRVEQLKGFIFEGITLSLYRGKADFKQKIASWVLSLDGEEEMQRVISRVDAFLTGGHEIQSMMPSLASPQSSADMILVDFKSHGELRTLVCPTTNRQTDVQVKATRSISDYRYGSIPWAVIGVKKNRREKIGLVKEINGRYRYCICWLSNAKGEPIWKLCHYQIDQLARSGDITSQVAEEAKRRIRGPEHFGLCQDHYDEVAYEFERVFSDPSADREKLRNLIMADAARLAHQYSHHSAIWKRGELAKDYLKQSISYPGQRIALSMIPTFSN